MNGLERVDLLNPVNWSHPLNDRRAMWLYGLPQVSGGGTLYDLTGRYPGTLTGGPVWSAGTQAAAVRYGPTNGQYVLCDQSDAPWRSAQPAFTVVAACRPDATGVTNTAAFNGYRYLVSVENSGSGAMQFTLRLRPSAQIFEWVIRDTAYRTASATVTLSSGRWYHLVGTFDGSGSALYVRDEAGGAWTATAGVGGGDANAGPVGLTVGGSVQQTNRQWSGDVEEASYLQRKVTAAEAFDFYDQWIRGHQLSLNRLRRKTYYVEAGVSPTPASAALVFDWW